MRQLHIISQYGDGAEYIVNWRTSLTAKQAFIEFLNQKQNVIPAIGDIECHFLAWLEDVGYASRLEVSAFCPTLERKKINK